MKQAEPARRAGPSRPWRVLIVGHDPQRMGRIHQILEADDRLEVVADSPDGDTAVAKASTADVVVIDRDIAGPGWLGTLSELVGTRRPPAIVVVTPVERRLAPDAARLGGVDEIVLWPADAPALGDRLAALGHRTGGRRERATH